MASTSQRPNKMQAQKRDLPSLGSPASPFLGHVYTKVFSEIKCPTGRNTTTSDEEMKVVQDTLHLIEEDHEGLEDVKLCLKFARCKSLFSIRNGMNRLAIVYKENSGLVHQLRGIFSKETSEAG